MKRIEIVALCWCTLFQDGLHYNPAWDKTGLEDWDQAIADFAKKYAGQPLDKNEIQNWFRTEVVSEAISNEAEISKLRAKALFVTPDGKEICVGCHEETDIDFETPVQARPYGWRREHGQLCRKCDVRFPQDAC